MNKRGDITINILVVGVFVVCTMALLSFSIVGGLTRNPKTQLNRLNLMEVANSQIERYTSPFAIHSRLNGMPIDGVTRKVDSESGRQMIYVDDTMEFSLTASEYLEYYAEYGEDATFYVKFFLK